ncbi:hypothetical protein M9H77_29547 [Catharanthus roseus]|uniref:Uncharacterized protein n=1 Tax=Catharanthus roseus TaxID=4058 RepID=A0ACB9ZUR7_CATRO|nr:hypothetical protein M9H77_29547 [Catharanthus roseus]
MQVDRLSWEVDKNVFKVELVDAGRAGLVNNSIFLSLPQVFEEESVVCFSNTSSNFEELCLRVVIRFHHPTKKLDIPYPTDVLKWTAKMGSLQHTVHPTTKK